jgi:hypothetical protein
MNYKAIKLAAKDSIEKVWLVGLFSSIISMIFGNFGYMYYLNDFVWVQMSLSLSLSQRIITENQNQYFQNKSYKTFGN